MRIAMIGTGYVGLVTGTCLAESAHQVVCVDVDREKVARLERGVSPIYEPGLTELLERNLKAGRLNFTTDCGLAVPGARVIFLAVGTPQADDGAADLTYLHAALTDIAPHLEEGQVVVIKSTVPVGTNARVAERLATLCRARVHVASNPEFLKEGTAILDFTKPDRVVVGVRDARVAELLQTLYAPFLRTERPFLVMSPESAELTKYVANAMLATKISFINEMASLCEKVGADVKEVHRGVCHDRRIGFPFMFPGVGYGGSCFPKDVRALLATCQEAGATARLIEAADRVNTEQKLLLFNKIHAHFNGLTQCSLVRDFGHDAKVFGVLEAPEQGAAFLGPRLV